MNTTIWKMLDELRSGKSELTSDQVAEQLSQSIPKPTAADIWLLCSQLMEKPRGAPVNKPDDPFNFFRRVFSGGSIFDSFFGAHGFQQPLPTIVTDFATDYFGALAPKRLLNPWTEEPVAVCTLLNALPSLQEATAVVRNPQSVWQAELFAQIAAKVLSWAKSPEWTVAQEAKASPPGASGGRRNGPRISDSKLS